MQDNVIIKFDIETFNRGANEAIKNDDVPLMKRVLSLLKRKTTIGEVHDPMNTMYSATLMDWTERAYVDKADNVFYYLTSESNFPIELKKFAFIEYLLSTEFEIGYVFYRILSDTIHVGNFLPVSHELCQKVDEFIDYSMDKLKQRDIDDLEYFLSKCNTEYRKKRAQTLLTRASGWKPRKKNRFGW